MTFGLEDAEKCEAVGGSLRDGNICSVDVQRLGIENILCEDLDGWMEDLNGKRCYFPLDNIKRIPPSSIKHMMEATSNDEDRLYGFQVQGAVHARNKDEAESILYGTLISRVEGLSQIIIR